MDQEHVAVAHGAERPAEPLELGPQLVCPLAVEDRTRHAKKSAQPADCDPQLVQRFGIASKPRARIVGEDLVVLPADHRLQVRQGRALVPRCLAPLSPADDQKPRILRLAVDVEAIDDAPAVQHLDLVVHLRVGRTVLLRAPRLQGGHFDQLALVEQPAKQVGDERRRLGRPTRLRERNFARRLGELDLPDAEPVLDPSAEGNPGAGEAAVGRVVVRRRKDAAHAAIVDEVASPANRELHPAF